MKRWWKAFQLNSDHCNNSIGKYRKIKVYCNHKVWGILKDTFYLDGWLYKLTQDEGLVIYGEGIKPMTSKEYDNMLLNELVEGMEKLDKVRITNKQTK